MTKNVNTPVYATYYNKVTIIQFSEFEVQTLGCTVTRFCRVEEVLRRGLV